MRLLRVRSTPKRQEATRSNTVTPPITFFWRSADPHRALTTVAVAAILAAFGLALFGLPPVDIHSQLHHVGVMDPLCGMTRAARALALGDLTRAWAYNPGIFALALAAGFLLVRALIGAVTGNWLAGVVVLSAVAALWLNQQINAALLMKFGIVH